MSNTKKAVSVLVAGGMLGFGGCLGVPSITDFATYAALEFVFDNDDGFGVDLFQDDFGTGTAYDDRFSDESSREEPTAG